jgi:hypothetical protein
VPVGGTGRKRRDSWIYACAYWVIYIFIQNFKRNNLVKYKRLICISTKYAAKYMAMALLSKMLQRDRFVFRKNTDFELVFVLSSRQDSTIFQIRKEKKIGGDYET